MKTIILFSDENIDKYFTSNNSKLLSEINSISDNEILNINLESTAEKFVKKYSIKPLEIDIQNIDNIQTLTERDGTPAMAGSKYSVASVIYTVPIKGDLNLLKLRPSQYTSNYPYGEITSDGIKVVIQTTYSTTPMPESFEESVVRDFKNILEKLKNAIENINMDCQKYNFALNTNIKDVLIKKGSDIRSVMASQDRLNKF